jgi:hypothetical protein
MPNVRVPVMCRLSSARLDAELAVGIAPETSPLHLSRARQLVNPRFRHARARDWEHVLVTSREPLRGLSGRVPPRREIVRQAAAEIQELIAALQQIGPVPARGVAIATTLLTDGCGALYNPAAINDLATTIARAVDHLDPTLPLTEDVIGYLHG